MLKEDKNYKTDVVKGEFDKKEFSKWKRKYVTYRGVVNDPYDTPENNRGAMLGKGLYTTKDKSSAKEYGTVYFVLGGVPQNPVVAHTLMDWENWLDNNFYTKFPNEKGETGFRAFDHQGKELHEELMNLGYDGVVIKGREMVHYNPEDVRYFFNSRQLEQYYETLIQEWSWD